MSKIKALIVTAVIASSSAAIAAPTVTASASASFRISAPSSQTVVIRDHRTTVTRDRYDDRYDRFERDRYERDRYDYDYRPRYEQNLNLTGRYTSNHGEVRLTQRGNQVFGTYVTAHDGISGVIQGTIVNGVIRFSWDQTTSEGFGVWQVSRDGRITGTWGNKSSSTDGGAWNLVATRR